jgi:hypothetical protein
MFVGDILKETVILYYLNLSSKFYQLELTFCIVIINTSIRPAKSSRRIQYCNTYRLLIPNC